MNTWETWGNLSPNSSQDIDTDSLAGTWVTCGTLFEGSDQDSLLCVEIPHDKLFGDINGPFGHEGSVIFYILSLFALLMCILSM